jgi:heme/copper-type cytochrome/quinol oxidase subunit 1
MHTLVRRFIKTAIGFLALGLLIGAWLIVRRELFDHHPTAYEVSAHTHALLVGFVMEMILGVALWLFPRPDKSDERYDPRLAGLAYWVLTISTAGRVVGELARSHVDAPVLRWAIVVFGLGQVAAVLLFFHTMWSRIRPLGSRMREAAGERF